MNYVKIQEFLSADPKYQPEAKTITGPDAPYSLLAMRVAKAMQDADMEDKISQRAYVLGFAKRIVAGILVVEEVLSAPAAKSVSAAKPKPVAKMTKPPKQAVVVVPAPVALAVEAKHAPEPVTVRCAPSPDVPLSPVRQQLSAQQVKLQQFVNSGDILKFQCAVAVGQLLAAVYQLMENDVWPGNDQRKSLLNSLLELYEEVSKTHINLSVKEIIRAKTEEQIAGQ